MGDRAVLIVRGMEQIDMGIYSQTSGGHFKILIPRGQRPFYICRL